MSSSSQTTGAARLLQRQLNEMRKAKDLEGVSVGLVNDNNVFVWQVGIMINDDCKYYGAVWESKCVADEFPPGGCFNATLTFPPEYPHLPPKLVFQTPIPFHPNIYANGELCISILHPPEEDKYGYESAAERWSPVQTPETILVSVLSLFNEPNDESPANLDAAKLLRLEREGESKEFRRRVRKCVRESLGED
ncbi:putative Ubiquitin conjugating enzyme-like protein [Seiridium unicorne]|uniref:Ubiquitin-conjugating enzyme E2 2 n=1 Tax=Seiridium unicorne TaxID=138068 RepID=A0ABR2V6N1_9PEZI